MIRNLIPLLTLLLALLAGSGMARAQEGGILPFTALGPDQGLPSGGITCMAQDREGYLWFGTENGLLRYEGRQVRRWTVADGLSSAYVASLHADADGSLWIAGLHGLVRYREGRIEPARFDTPAGASQGVSLVAPDRRGRLWVLSARRTYRQEEGLSFKELTSNPEPNAYALAAGSRGAMYLAGGKGVHAFFPDGTLRSWGPESGLPATGTTFVAEDGEGRIWAGSARTLMVLRPGTNRFEDRSQLLGGSLSPVGTAYADADGTLWLSTLNGLLHLQGERATRVGSEQGLPFKWVRSTFRDREGTLWVLGPSLARLLGGGRVRTFTVGREPLGEMVWWIHRRAGGELFVGTDDGAARMTPQGLVRIPGTEGLRIKSLADDREGNLWMVGTRGPTLWLRPGRTRAETAPIGPLGSPANVIWPDSRGDLWIGHVSQGPIRWDAKARKLVQELPPSALGLATLGSFGMQEEPSGRIWAASTAGLLMRNPDGTWRCFGAREGLPPFPMRSLVLNPDGSLWVHFQEALGLLRVRVEGDHLVTLEHLRKGKGVRSDVIYALGRDAQGALWVTTDQGVDRLDPAMHVGRQEGMVSEDCSVLALRLEEDAAWVGTSAGLMRLDRTLAIPASAPPQAQVLRATFGDRSFDPPFGALDPIPHAQATGVFQVAAPTYGRSRDLRFQVRLLGLEEGWRDVEAGEVRYPALPGGSYRFEVRAGLDDAFGPVSGFSFRVRPPWWRTWWALTLQALALGAAGFGVLRMRLAALARAKAELESQVAGRTQELQLRNRELSEALTQVKQLSGLLPICACCKKIRDDKGYWNQLEVYISKHSDADFTHGICPECAKDFYPSLHQRPRPETAPEGDGPA